MATNGLDRNVRRVQQALDDLPEEQLLAVLSAALEHPPALAKVRDDVMAALYTGLGAGTLDWSRATATHTRGPGADRGGRAARRAGHPDADGRTGRGSRAQQQQQSPRGRQRYAQAGEGGRPGGRWAWRSVGLEVGGRTVFPAFQFDRTRARLRPVVAEINRQLGAASDPWGVASWWLAPSVWRDDDVSPADLASKGDEEAVRPLAAAETEGY